LVSRLRTLDKNGPVDVELRVCLSIDDHPSSCDEYGKQGGIYTEGGLHTKKLVLDTLKPTLPESITVSKGNWLYFSLNPVV
jgi:hypothetical protein